MKIILNGRSRQGEVEKSKTDAGRLEPQVGAGGFLAPTAQLIGDVRAGKDCSFWFNTIVRGDVSPIEIGDQVNVQDGVVIHGTFEKFSVRIGSGVSIGHSALIHGCVIESNCLIGMGAILMDGCHIGEGSLVAAGTLVGPGKKYEPGSVIIGRPGRRQRGIRDEERELIRKTTENYIMYKNWYTDCEVVR